MGLEYSSALLNIALQYESLIRYQAKLPIGATLIPIIIGSDKTHLTELAGNKHAWPLYLTIGNIKSRTRNRPSNYAWVPIAYIPTPHFSDPKKTRTTLQARLYHQCLRIVFNPLRCLGSGSIPMADPHGNIRDCYLRIGIHQADLPEQNLISLTSQNLCPNFITTREELGDGKPKEYRTSQWINQKIAELVLVGANDVKAYQDVARSVGLNGVDQPYWDGLPGYRPEFCCAPDILHGLLRFWRDHVLKWIIRLVGQDELDRRLAVLQPITGIRSFQTGVHHLSQWTGKEDRELLRVILPSIVGCPKISPEVMRCLRAFHDFLYLAQFRMHSTITLREMSEALSTFHRLKRIFLKNGARRGKKGPIQHFNIPKLAPMRFYSPHIVDMGTSPQFSTEIIEVCHKTMAKQPYRLTNGRNIQEQICRYLDRVDRIEHFNEIFNQYKTYQRNRSINTELDSHSEEYQALVWKHIRAAETSWQVRVPRNDRITCNLAPDLRRQSIHRITQLYDLPDLSDAITKFISHMPRTKPVPPLLNMDVWYKMRIRTPSVQDDDEEDQVRAVNALPPSNDLPFGLCNHVLVHFGPEARNTGVEGKQLFVKSIVS